MHRNHLQRSALFVAILACAACVHRTASTSASALDSTPAPATQESTDYRIGPEDVIEVSVWRNEAISRTVPVRPDGAISLPLINDLQAAGLTPMQLRQLVVQKLTVYIPAPEVSVIVREVHSSKVSVLGQVVHPGLYELRGPETVLELLAHAGGLSPFASKSQIVVLRTRSGRAERILVDEDRALAEKHNENVSLESGDLVFVP